MGAVKDMIFTYHDAGLIPIEPAEVTALGITDVRTIPHYSRHTGNTVELLGVTPAVAVEALDRLNFRHPLRQGWKDRIIESGLLESARLPDVCPCCAEKHPQYFVAAQFIGGRLHIHDADEPEGPTYLSAWCPECENAVAVPPPEWTDDMRLDALAAGNAAGLREALQSILRAARNDAPMGMIEEIAKAALATISAL